MLQGGGVAAGSSLLPNEEDAPDEGLSTVRGEVEVENKLVVSKDSET